MTNENQIYFKPCSQCGDSDCIMQGKEDTLPICEDYIRKEKPISEIFEDIKTAMCEDYCRFTDDVYRDIEDLQTICEGCPLNRL